ncbi:hypothetical protein ABZO31_11165 [Streptomyces sp. HUAS MG47]|uniref:hypothetical protein n=1 Tax=Streptomyces solicamelliae TaxID=3231716 RepID=UPI00387817FD
MSFLIPVAVAFLIGTLIRKVMLRPPSAERRGVDRWVRDSFVPAAYGLVPRAALDAGRAGPPPPAHRLQQMQAVADAAWDGDWRPAASYVADAGDDWDARWSRTEFLQHLATEDEGWLRAWRAEQPGNCDAATLDAGLMVHRAWQIRGSGYAHQVPADRMQQFRQMLPAAMQAAREASALDARNPGPLVVMITVARAVSCSRREFRAMWAELTARAPHHYAAHWQALQFWCAKWHGSERLMMRFAVRAVRSAPDGSPLSGMYLHALEELDERSSGAGRMRAQLGTRRLVRVARSLDQVAPDREELPRLRHMLAHYLVEAGRHKDALEQFRLIGPWCGASPWDDSPDPIAAFDRARGRAAKRTKAQANPKGTTSMRL